MGSRNSSSGRRALAKLATGLTLTTGGASSALAWQAEAWATLFGAALCTLTVIGAGCWSASRPDPLGPPLTTTTLDAEDASLRVLLDQIPLPLVRIDRLGVHAMNRAARILFGTDDRVLPAPSGLLDGMAKRMRHEGRSWRIDAVETTDGLRLAVLIDVDSEQRLAEDHANDELIDILGHELLNGLSPIVSLAESAVTAAGRGDDMLPDILATLARRVEGLEKFTRAYRKLSRLPDPVPSPVSLEQIAADMALLFAGRFQADVALVVDVSLSQFANVDCDQLIQAVWALLQNGAEAALAAIPPRQVTLAMSVEHDGLTIQVSDSGAGIAGADRARIFRPFYTTKTEGSGIGLSLARRIARAHGGDAWLMETAATRFRMKIPSAAPSPKLQEASSTNQPDGGGVPEKRD